MTDAYSGPTRDGPRTCLHGAPIDTVCVDCALEVLQTALNASNEALIRGLEALAEVRQSARIEIEDGGGLVIVVTKCEHRSYGRFTLHTLDKSHGRYHYYLSNLNGMEWVDRGLVDFALEVKRATAERQARSAQW